MAIENNDLFVLQKGGGGELRKATVAALIASLPKSDAPTLDEVTTAGNNSETAITIGPDSSPTIELKEDGGITGKSLDVDNAVTAGTSISAATSITAGSTITAGMSILASDSIQAINKAHIGADAQPVQITLDGTTGEIGGAASVYIDGGEYAT